MRITFFTFFLLLYCIGIKAQAAKTTNDSIPQLDSAKDAALLIPYNNHGKWGWCDTLGKVIIAPKYKKVNFFYKRNNIYSASITTEAGTNRYVINKGLVVPENSAIVSKLYLSDTSIKGEFYIVKNKLDKIGIYESNTKKFVVPIEYDSYPRYFSSQHLILLKKEGELTYDRFIPKLQEVVPTDIVKVSEYMSFGDRYEQSIIVTEHIEGYHSKLKNGTLVRFDLKKSGKWTDSKDVGIVMEEGYGSGDYGEPTLKPWPNHSLPKDGIIKTYNYSRYKEKYGFSSLSIVQKDNKLGVIDDNKKVVLPYEYDKLIFKENNTQIQLYKGGKQGRKILFTTYPTIEAKYDKLRFTKGIRVTKSWQFAVFRVKMGKQYGYVGENGIEYFDLD